MIHLKRFNEEVGNPKLLDFYNEYKNLFEGEIFKTISRRVRTL